MSATRWIAASVILLSVGCGPNACKASEPLKDVQLQLQQQNETLKALREQMERDECERYVRSTLPAGTPISPSLCSDPQSAFRQLSHAQP